MEGFTPPYRGKTVSKFFVLELLGLALIEKQIPQIIENIRNAYKPKEALETAEVRPRQVLRQSPFRS